MTSTNAFVGIRDEQRISSRVLKPPGGGSSIVFDEDENMKPVKSKPQPQQPEPQPKQEAPQAEKQQEQPPQPQQQAGDPKPETNGMNDIDCVKENAAATRDSNPFPTPATNGQATNGQQSPALNGPLAVNGSSATDGSNRSVSSGSTSSMSSYPSGIPKHFNTQTRIFGQEQNVLTPRRRLRDHERSNIFSAEDASSNGTHRPADTPSSSPCPSSGTPETKTPDRAQLQQRQRVPPGGFSTKLW